MVANNNGPVRLLLKQNGSRNHWLEVQLEGVKTNRLGVGSSVAVLREGERTLWRRAHTDGSYLSASDSRVHFGLGNNANIEAVDVEWLGGRREMWTGVKADRIVKFREGTGQAPRAPLGGGRDQGREQQAGEGVDRLHVRNRIRRNHERRSDLTPSRAPVLRERCPLLPLRHVHAPNEQPQGQ